MLQLWLLMNVKFVIIQASESKEASIQCEMLEFSKTDSLDCISIDWLKTENKQVSKSTPDNGASMYNAEEAVELDVITLFLKVITSIYALNAAKTTLDKIQL